MVVTLSVCKLTAYHFTSLHRNIYVISEDYDLTKAREKIAKSEGITIEAVKKTYPLFKKISGGRIIIPTESLLII